MRSDDCLSRATLSACWRLNALSSSKNFAVLVDIPDFDEPTAELVSLCCPVSVRGCLHFLSPAGGGKALDCMVSMELSEESSDNGSGDVASWPSTVEGAFCQISDEERSSMN